MKQRLKKPKISLGRLLCFQPRTRSGAGSLDNQERDNYEEGGKLKKEFLHTTRPLRIFFVRNRDFISLWWNVFNILSKNLYHRHKSWSFLVILIHISLTWRFFCICMLTKKYKIQIFRDWWSTRHWAQHSYLQGFVRSSHHGLRKLNLCCEKSFFVSARQRLCPQIDLLCICEEAHLRFILQVYFLLQDLAGILSTPGILFLLQVYFIYSRYTDTLLWDPGDVNNE